MKYLFAEWGDDEDGEWQRILNDLKKGHFNIDLYVYKPVIEGPTYTMEAVTSTFTYGNEMLTILIKNGLQDHTLSKPWYYSNTVVDEIVEWGGDVFQILKNAVVELWELRLTWVKSEVEMDAMGKVEQHGHEKPTVTQKRLNIVLVQFFKDIFTQMSAVCWARILPLPTLGSRPIVLKAELREFYESWKDAAFKKAQLQMTRTDREEIGKEIDYIVENSVREPDYFVNYPDIRVSDQKDVLLFPKKEVPRSGFGIAKELGLRVPYPSSDTLPTKYFLGTPKVGDVPLPGGFPSNFSEFTNEDVFWLVVFYNESFALQCRRQDKPSDHLFEVWWYLSYMAAHGGKPPYDDEYAKSQSEGEKEE